MDIIISNASTLPIYEQISLQIKKAIISGVLKEGNPLPSIRRLAKDIQVSVITTKRAYEELEHESLIVSVRGKGFYVATKNMELFREKKIRLIEDKLTEVIDECRMLDISSDELVNMINLLYEDE